MQGRSFSWRRSAAIIMILCISAAMVVAYLQMKATTFGEIFWAWSLILFITTLMISRVGNFLSIKGYAKGRALWMTSYLFFHVTSSLLVSATAYRFEGPEAALFTGVIWFFLLLFLSVRDAGHRRL